MNYLVRGLVLFVLLGSSALKAETFTDSAIGVSITAPDGWKHDEKDPFGYVIRDPAATGDDCIRLHLVNPKTSSLEDAIKSSAGKDREIRTLNKLPAEEMLSSKPVVTAGGIKGYKESFGTKNADGTTSVTVNRYYFQRPDGAIFCVLASVQGKPQTADSYEKIILGTLRLVETARAGESLPSKGQKESYTGESFYAPKMTLSIFTLHSTPPRDAFVQLLEQPDKRVLASLHWPEARRISALWNPASSMVAIDYRIDDKLARMKVFRVSAGGLIEIPLPKSLSIRKLVPPNSPLRDSDPAGEKITSDRWKSAEELFCVVESPAKNPNPTSKHDENAPAKSAGSVSYEVLLGFNGKEATLLSSKLIEKKAP